MLCLNFHFKKCKISFFKKLNFDACTRHYHTFSKKCLGYVWREIKKATKSNKVVIMNDFTHLYIGRSTGTNRLEKKSIGDF